MSTSKKFKKTLTPIELNYRKIAELLLAKYFDGLYDIPTTIGKMEHLLIHHSSSKKIFNR